MNTRPLIDPKSKPKVPGRFIVVDDKMQAGYVVRRERANAEEVCRLWLETWQAILDIVDRHGMASLDEFDDHFGGTQSVFNWVQDFDMELYNAGIEDAKYFRERITLCGTLLSRFSGGELPMDNFKMALAESYFQLGDREKGDRLFRAWSLRHKADGGPKRTVSIRQRQEIQEVLRQNRCGRTERHRLNRSQRGLGSRPTYLSKNSMQRRERANTVQPQVVR